MLLRYAALGHGMPRTEEEWETFRAWKARQLALPECDMAKPEASPASAKKCCGSCKGGPGCTKKKGGA